MQELELPDGTVIEFDDSVRPEVMNMVAKNYVSRPYEHQTFTNPLQGVTEAFAQGVYEAPGQLAAIADEFSPWARVYNALSGKTLQSRMDDLTGVNELGYTPDEYGASPLLQSVSRLLGNVTGDPLNAIPVGMVGKAGALRAADTLSDDALTTPMRNQLGMLAGPNAKNADLGMLAKAQELKAKGVDADSIYQDTQWWLDHPDGVPRFEIDDSWSMPISQKTMSWGERADWEAGNPTLLRRQKALAHPKLSAAYPDSKNIAVSMRQDLGDSGSYKSDMDWITVGGESNGAANRSTMLHELQHAIQSREGMARGGSPEMFKTQPSQVESLRLTYDAMRDGREVSDYLWDIGVRSTKEEGFTDKLKEAAKFLGMPEDTAAYGLLAQLGDRSYLPNPMVTKRFVERARKSYEGAASESVSGLNAHEKYRALAGEADARLVQNRMNMSMDERLANPFYKGYDVPLEDQIVRFDDGNMRLKKP